MQVLRATVRGTILAVLLVGTGCTPFGGSSPSPGPSSSPSSTATPAATPTATPSPTVAACDRTMLKVRLLTSSGAAGSVLPTYVFFNTSANTCYLQGQPGLTVLDASNHVLFSQPAVPDPTAPRVPLQPGVTDPGTATAPHGTATADYRIANWCMVGTVQSFAVELTTGGSVSASGALQLPGCNSAPGTPPLIESKAFAAAP
ncbi:MAG TPA: DUF4232 domain-containing protein [Candidatus Dormibacteraeota bacterium]